MDIACSMTDRSDKSEGPASPLSLDSSEDSSLPDHTKHFITHTELLVEDFTHTCLHYKHINESLDTTLDSSNDMDTNSTLESSIDMDTNAIAKVLDQKLNIRGDENNKLDSDHEHKIQSRQNLPTTYASSQYREYTRTSRNSGERNLRQVLDPELVTRLIERDPHLNSRLVAPDPPLEARLVTPECLPRVKRHQYHLLENSFKQCRNPHYIDIMLVAAQCGLAEETVTIWFEHRLALWRKQQGLPANSSHVFNH